VLSEALYAGLRVRPVLREQLRDAPAAAEKITLRSFLDFYIPLAMTSLLFLLIQPLGSAALSRMPKALESLAAWPVVSGLVFLLRSPGVAYNEVAVALLDKPKSEIYLVRFAMRLMGVMTGLLLLVVVTPISIFWFEKLTSLESGLAQMASRALWFTLPLPAIAVLISWFQGVLLNARRTRSVTQAVIVGLVVISMVLTVGVIWGEVVGLYVGWIAFSLGMIAQVTWLWRRSRRLRSVSPAV
jgi:Na+-driven multidrug efflux pump